jgi:hypothetical protein
LEGDKAHYNGLGIHDQGTPPSKQKPGELIPLKKAIELHINNQLEEASEPRKIKITLLTKTNNRFKTQKQIEINTERRSSSLD